MKAQRVNARGRNQQRQPLVSHVFPLDTISDAFRDADWMRRREAGPKISRAAISM